MTLSETLRAAIAADGRPLHFLAQEIGMEQSSLHRFTTEDPGVLPGAVETLAAYFGLELIQEIVWDQYVEKEWPLTAAVLWKEYAPDAWRDAVASGDWEEAQYAEWEHEEHAAWDENMRDVFEASERERLSALPWVRIVEEE